MNARCFKTVFSEHLGCLVAVGEHACSQGKSSGESPAGAAATAGSAVAVFIGAVVLSMAWVGLAWASPVANALPSGGQVVQGAASMVQSSSPTASQLTIHQASQRAAINWQSFDIGAAAKVNVVQPNAQAVLLNRVVGQSPSQIFGQLQANGHVILVNPNGVLFGKDGSVNAGSFTASTLGISDANFMAGNMVYERNGSTAGVVNQGQIEVSPGGYVALLGASVSNEGKIIAPKGGVAFGAAETIKVPVSGSGRIKLELTAGDINASVKNSGAIVAEGGQVYMQALALNRAAAQILQSGRIDTTGEQGGAVHLLADGGTIKVDGNITANSTGTDDNGQALAGGDIYIGRDKDTNVLAAVGDVSGAQLESRGGFVETSGQYLVTTGTRVLAKDWLLDPYNITIAASGASGTAYSSAYTPGADSVILASDIAANLNAGTNVTIETGLGGSAGTSDGNIVVNAAIVKSGSSNASLTLTAHNGITVNQRIGRAAADTTSTGKLDVVMSANGDATNALNSQGITLNNVIDANGGQVTLTGTSKNTSGVQTGPTYTYGVANNSRSGVVFNNGSGITADNYQVTGTHTVAAGNSFGVNGVYMNGAVTFKANGNTDSNITGNSNAQGNFGSGVMVWDGATVRLENQGTGLTTLKGSNTNIGGGNGVRIGASTNSAVINAIGRVTIGQQSAGVNAPVFIRGNLNASQNSVNLGGLSVLGQTGLNTPAVQIWDAAVSAAGIDVVIDGVTGNGTGVLIQNNPTTTWTIKNLSVTGVANTTLGSSGSGVVVQRYPNFLTVNASGNISIQGTVQGAGTGRGLHFAESGWGAQAPRLTATGNITLRGNNRASSSNTNEAVYIASGVQVTAGGNIVLQGETNNAAANAIHFYSVATGSTAWNTAGASALQGNTTLQATGNVLVQSNQGSIWLNNQLSSTLNNGGTPLLTSDTKITGLNITLDNTGAGMTTGASNTVGSGSIDASGFVTQGSGKSTSNLAGIRLTDGRAITARNSLNIFGASTIGSGVAISGTTALSAGATGFTGNMFIRGENTSAAGAAINISNASSTLSATNILNLTSSGTGSGTSLVAAGGIQVGAELQVENPAAGTISGVISGNGLLRKIGSTGFGTLALTATNTYTGGTVANGGILQVGNGGTTGTLGVGGTVSVGAVLSFMRSNVVEVSQAISGAGQLWQTGTGTTVLTGNNTYTGSTVVSAGTLQVGNGGSAGTLGTGAVTLSNNANLSFVRSADTVIGNAISGAGNVSASITGADSDLTVNGAMALTGGTANLAADGHLTVSQSIGTTNSGNAAVVLTAGKALSAGDASGGNIVFSGSGAVSVGGSGRATLFTGSVAGSTGLGIVAGNNRFNSDEVSSGYTTALGSGTYAVYREAPSLAVAFDNALKTYDGLSFAGGTTQVQGWVGNDSVAQLGSLSYSGTAQGAVNAGVYSISGTASSASALGYNVTYTPGTLTVDRASLTASLTGPISKEYDGTHGASGLSNANFVITGWASPNGVTEGATVAQTFATYISKNVPDNTGAGTVTATLSTADFTPTGSTLFSNYVLPTSASGNVGTITPAPLEVKVGSTAMFVTQNPNTAFDTGITYDGLKNGETSSAVLGALTRAYNGVANPAIGDYTGVYGLSAVPTAANYTVTVTPGNLNVLAADKLLIQVGSRSQTYGAVMGSNAGVTTASQGVSALYCVGGVTCNTISTLTLTDLGSGNWRATDTLGSSIRFSTRVDVSGAISPAGYLSVGNHDYSVGSLTVEGGQNFTSMALAGGALTITPKALSLTAPNVTKVYDGSDRLAGMGLTPSGALAGDVVTALASGGTFAGQNAGAQTFTLSGLQLQGADKANYSLSPEPVSGTGSITPKTLSLSAWALNKTFDGTTTATVNWGALTGLVGSEQLGVSSLGLFANADVGHDKAVFASFSLADGANGGFASNYVLAPQTLTASILKKNDVAPAPASAPAPADLTGRDRPAIRPVQPEAWPLTSSHKFTRVVYQPAPLASVSQPALGRSESGPCSDEPTDSCMCENSPVAGIQICYVSKGALDNEPTQTAKSE